MKRIAELLLLAAVMASSTAFAQSGDMKGMDMKSCKDMKGMDMKGMDMKGMDMKACHDMMNNHAQGTSKNGTVHQATAVVKAVDSASNTVTLAHEAVKSLNWPAMTMGFSVKDETLLDKLTVGKKVDVEFTQQGSDYVITAVK
jgi:Cu/Ag efflux protein CusF